MYFETYNLDRVKAIVSEYIKANRSDVSIKFSSPEVFNEAKKQLVDEGQFGEVIKFASLKTNVKLNSRYMYSANEDRLTIALFTTKI